MPAVLDDSSKEQLLNAQLVIEKLARREITEEEAQRSLEEIWERAYDEPLLRRLLRQLLPALSRTSGTSR
jgi:hypothetical protein